MSENCPDAAPLADLLGDTPAAFIGICLLRSGVMRLEGAITDERAARRMLDDARATLAEYHRQQKAGRRSPILVHADDTRTIGTPRERALLAGETPPTPAGGGPRATAALDGLHGDTLVAFIGLLLLRSGMLRIEGSITDEDFVRYMLDTAGDVLTSHHARQRLASGGAVLIPAGDTALAGTPEADALTAARDELADAMSRAP